MNLQFVKKENSLVSNGKNIDFEIERSVIKKTNDIFISASIENINELSLCQKYCNNFNSFIQIPNFFFKYKYVVCYVANVYNQDKILIHSIAEENFDSFAREFSIFFSKEKDKQTYLSSFYKFGCLKHDKGYIVLDLIEELDSFVCMNSILESKYYKDLSNKINKHEQKKLNI